jgi:hypothetical protein
VRFQPKAGWICFGPIVRQNITGMAACEEGSCSLQGSQEGEREREREREREERREKGMRDRDRI